MQLVVVTDDAVIAPTMTGNVVSAATVTVTVTVAVADFVGSCWLVAVTVTVCAVVGDVKTPDWVIVPALVAHVTACDGAFVPVTTAENGEIAPPVTDAVAGETVTDDTVDVVVVVVVPAVGLPEMPTIDTGCVPETDRVPAAFVSVIVGR